MKYKNIFILSIILAVLISFTVISCAETLNKSRWGFIIGQRSAEPPATNDDYGALYVQDKGGTMTLIFQDDADATTDLISNASGGDLDDAYDNGATITADGGAVTINNTDADAANNLTVNKTPGSSIGGNTIGIVSGANCTGNSLDIANSGTGYDIDGTSSSWYVTKAGVITCASLVATTNYMAAIASAASGNTSLTIDAAGNGTITIAGTSTGRIINTTETDFLGAVDIGDAATDTLTITSIVDANLTFDDGSGAAPGVVLKDGSDESATLVKVDSGYATFTTEAADGLNILTGSLKIGNGSPGSAPDGEDLYVEGTVEIDGTSTFDGAITANNTVALSENVTFTMAADEYLRLDAATTPMTSTVGALDINVINGANTVSAINIDFEAENTYVAGYGLYVNIDDDATGGEEHLHAIYVDNSEGTASNTYGMSVSNKVDIALKSTVGAAMQAIVIDAAATDNTGTSGVIDIDYDTITDGASAINIDMAAPTGGADADDYSAILIDLDDDTDATADVIGVKVVSSDLTGDTNTKVIGFYASGLDVALQADNGYVRIGTGSTQSQALGDDDMFVEGHVEIDAALYVDDTIVGDGATTMLGVIQDVSACTSDTVLTIAQAGILITNTGAGGAVVASLPEGSTCNGASYSFAVTAAQNLDINPDDGDTILGLCNAAGDAARSNAAGDFITLTCVGDNSWVVSATNNSTNSADGWADAN